MKLQLSSLFTHHAVLQRGKQIRVFGRATEGDRVFLRLGTFQASCVADSHRNWLVQLPAMDAGGPFSLTVTDERGEQIELTDILIGDVFLCSGQSNMEWPVSGALNPQQEIATANYDQIRLYQVPKYASGEPFDQMQSRWEICSPQSVASFSAVAYFFGRSLYQTCGVPIGLINSSWGGTLCEAWTSERALSQFEPILDRLADARKGVTQEVQQRYLEQLQKWEDKFTYKDPGNQGESWGWAALTCDTSSWKTMDLPTAWERTGLNIDGAVWFRRDMVIPDGWSGQDLTLSLGAIDDYDDTYFNGVRIGGINSDTVDAWRIPRIYTVPAQLVRTGRNNISVRVFDRINDGGMTGPATKMSVGPAQSAADTIALAGEWLYKIELELKPRIADPAPPPPITVDNQNCPGSLYNGMIYPLIQFSIRGFIWYQGESNRHRAEQYRTLFPNMIRDWRKWWGDDQFPFIYVELPCWNHPPTEPTESEIAELREAQSFALALPNVGRATIIDTGDIYEIHPPDKQTVGTRLAMVARSMIYGDQIDPDGPIFLSMTVQDGQCRLRFSHAAGGLATFDHQPLRGFAIAGEDHKFVWAQARIIGNEIHLSSPSVPYPVAVRYGWADNPGCNLSNAAGIPASPFRTDKWPGLTDGRT